MGYCSGFALKKVGKALAVVVGLGFVAVQGAVYGGYLNVDWAKIKADGFKKIDTVRLDCCCELCIIPLLLVILCLTSPH